MFGGGGVMAYLDTEIRQPAVAGLFYPGEASELAENLDQLLADSQQIEIEEPLVALVSPHAGYPFSGHVAAEAYALLKGREIRRVVVISPSHVEAFQGASVYNGEGYATPLGVIPVDTDFCRKLASKSKRIEYSNQGHRDGPQGRGGTCPRSTVAFSAAGTGRIPVGADRHGGPAFHHVQGPGSSIG